MQQGDLRIVQVAETLYMVQRQEETEVVPLFSVSSKDSVNAFVRTRGLQLVEETTCESYPAWVYRRGQ